MSYFITILALLLLSGCVASYQHLDPTPFNNDGMAYDFLCGGLEYDLKSVRLRGDLCSNIASNGGDFFHGAVEYRFGRVPK